MEWSRVETLKWSGVEYGSVETVEWSTVQLDREENYGGVG